MIRERTRSTLSGWLMVPVIVAGLVGAVVLLGTGASSEPPNAWMIVPAVLAIPVLAVMVIGFFIVLSIGIWAFQALGTFLFILLLAWLFSIAMEPPVLWMVRRGVRRGLATGIVLILGLIMLLGLTALQRGVQIPGRELDVALTRRAHEPEQRRARRLPAEWILGCFGLRGRWRRRGWLRRQRRGAENSHRREPSNRSIPAVQTREGASHGVGRAPHGPQTACHGHCPVLHDRRVVRVLILARRPASRAPVDPLPMARRRLTAPCGPLLS